MSFVLRAGMVLPFLAFAQPLAADPAVGLSITLLNDGQIAAGIKVLSTDKHNDPALTIGLDYNFDSKSLRPNAGIAYLHDQFFVDVNVGWDFGDRRVDYGAALGMLHEEAVISSNAGGPPSLTLPSTITPASPSPTPSPTGGTDLTKLTDEEET